MSPLRFVFGSVAEIRDCSVFTQVDFTDRERGWMAEDPTRPGCVGYGATLEEARESLGRARQAYDLTQTRDAASEDPELFAETIDSADEVGGRWQKSIPPVGAELTTA